MLQYPLNFNTLNQTPLKYPDNKDHVLIIDARLFSVVSICLFE